MPGVPASVTNAMLSPAAKAFDQLRRPLAFVVFVVADRGLADAEVLQQASGVARVLARDQIQPLSTHARRVA
jgi:hypothetical protein